MTTLQLAKAHYPVTALGPGTRAGIWTQGCTIGCAGCIAHDTWAADPATEADVAVVVSWLASLPGPVDGVTISGGEPFQQPAALGELLTGIHCWRGGRDIDILIYSGYPLSRLQRAAWSARLLALCDAVVAGPYVRARNTGLRWRGSANQQIVPLSTLGARRYPAGAGQPGAAPKLQVSVQGDRTYLIGIPHSGDLDRLAGQLARSGVRVGNVSWRA